MDDSVLLYLEKFQKVVIAWFTAVGHSAISAAAVSAALVTHAPLLYVVGGVSTFAAGMWISIETAKLFQLLGFGSSNFHWLSFPLSGALTVALTSMAFQLIAASH